MEIPFSELLFHVPKWGFHPQSVKRERILLVFGQKVNDGVHNRHVNYLPRTERLKSTENYFQAAICDLCRFDNSSFT